MNFNFRKIKTSSQEINAIVPEIFGTIIPSSVKKLGKFQFDGLITLNSNKIESDFNLNLERGIINSSLNISNLSILLSFLLSIYLLFIYISSNTSAISKYVITIDDVKIYSLSYGLYIDSLSLVMCTVVTSVSFLVHYYSISYMKDEKSFNRFFVYTNFFTFSMLLIVLSNNFFQLFIGWELVGLSSYLLIGVWIKKDSALKANYKAVFVHRVGDSGLVVG